MQEFPEINQFLKPDCVIDLGIVSKEEALMTLVETLCKSQKIENCHLVKQAIIARESLMSTGIGFGIAIPHARFDFLDHFIVGMARCKNGINYESMDKKPIKLIFMILAPELQHDQYIKILARLMTRIKDKKIVKTLLESENISSLYDIIVTTK